MRYNQRGFQAQAARRARLMGPLYGRRYIIARVENMRRHAAVMP